MNSTKAHGRLTTHVLDTARGCPAAGMKIELFRISGEAREALKTVVTNEDGRVDGALLEEAELLVGGYELVFHAGDYLKIHGAQLGDVLFLDIIPIRFGIAKSDEHYHIPLLLSPFSYSTYRGS